MKTRNEIPAEFKWNLTQIFASDAEWEKTLEDVSRKAERLAAYEGRLGESAEIFGEAISFAFSVFEEYDPVAIYALLRHSADGGDPEAQSIDARSQSVAVKLSTAFSYAQPEILAMDGETLERYMSGDGMKIYRRFIDAILRGKPHTLDASGENMLARLGDAASAPSDIFGTMTNVDMTFPKVTDENGNEVELTNGNFGVFRENPDRGVRERAFNAFLGRYKEYNNTFAAMYAGSVKMDCFDASVRNFGSALEAGLFGSNVPVSVYDSLCEAIHSSFPLMKRYIALRTKKMNAEKIDMFDLYTPLVDNVDFGIPFDEGKRLVKEALKPLGEEYGKLLDEAYADNWLDVYENKGKQSGAYSCGLYGVHPFILLNYTDTFDDAFTLAHELGHAMHSYRSDKAQDYPNHNYRITVAEVASTVNEVLLTMYLLGIEKDRKRRAYILNHFLEGFRTTVFRQTLFAEFEREAHALYEDGKPLTASTLNALYYGLVSKYYEGAEINKLIEVEWSYIPHFYTPFYVYQYATGFCSAVAIAKNIIETGDNSAYLKFLSLGGSEDPLDELKTAGIDLTTPATFENAMKLFESTIAELEELL